MLGHKRKVAAVLRCVRSIGLSHGFRRAAKAYGDLAFFILIAMVFSGQAMATTGNWSNVAAGNWTDTGGAGWTGGIPNGIGDTAMYTVVGGGSLSSTTTQNISGGVTVGTINLAGSSNKNWTIAPSGLVTLNQDGAGSGSATISNTNGNAGSNLVNALIIDNGPLLLADDLLVTNLGNGGNSSTRLSGSIQLKCNIFTAPSTAFSITFNNVTNSVNNGAIAVVANNSFSGNVAVERGAVTFNNRAAFGNLASNTITLGKAGSGAATLVMTAQDSAMANNFVVAAGSVGTLMLGSSSTDTQAQTFSGAFTLNDDLTLTSALVTGGLRLTGVISGAGGLTKVDTGVVDLRGANTYAGDTTVSVGTLRVGSNNDVIPDGTGKGNLLVNNNGTFDLNGFDEAVNGLTNANTETNGIVTNSAAGSATLTIGKKNVTSTFDGLIQDGTGGVGITKTGNGTQTLTHANTYTGTTSIDNGTLKISTIAPTNITAQPLGQGTSAILLGSGNTGTLEYAGSTAADLERNVTVNGAGGGIIKNSGGSTLTLGGMLTKDGRTLTLTGGAFNITGSIVGASANSDLNVDAATVTLSNTNSYNGLTSIYNGGTLIAGVTDALPNPTFTTIKLGSGATSGKLILGTASGAVTETVAGLAIGGSAGIANAVVGGNAAASTLILNHSTPQTFGGTLGGAGTNENSLKITKSGSGTLTLTNGTNSYSGGTTITAGTLLANNNNNNSVLGTGPVDINGGTLAGNGNATGSAVHVNAGGTIAAGTATSIDKLKTGAQTWNSGGTYAVKLNTTGINLTAGNGFDQLVMSGLTLAIATPKFTVAISSLLSGGGATFDGASNYSWTIVDTSNAISGFDTNLFALNTNGFTGAGYLPSPDNTSSSGTFSLSLASGGQDIQLNYTAAPEPTSLLLFSAVVMPVFAGRRRRQTDTSTSA